MPKVCAGEDRTGRVQRVVLTGICRLMCVSPSV
jgi:hypothetical protein